MKKILLILAMLFIPIYVNALDATSLSVEGSKIDLKENIYEYDVKVDNSCEKANIVVETENDITYEIVGNEDFIVGTNIVIIKLSNGKEYVLNILRKAEDVVELSNNNKLENLSVYGYPLGFDADVLEYNIKIGTESKLSITYMTENDEATVYVEGNEGLVKGSTIKIKVIAQSGDVREYKINIVQAEKRQEPITNEPSGIDIKLVIYGGLIIIIGGFLIYINNKNDNQEKKTK